jgi:hypothetical protein
MDERPTTDVLAGATDFTLTLLVRAAGLSSPCPFARRAMHRARNFFPRRPLSTLSPIRSDCVTTSNNATAPNKVMDKAATALRKQEQAREGAKAMAEYQADLIAEQKKTEKLRALRLAREAAESARTEAATLVAKPKAANKAAKPKARAKRPARVPVSDDA